MEVTMIILVLGAILLYVPALMLVLWNKERAVKAKHAIQRRENIADVREAVYGPVQMPVKIAKPEPAQYRMYGAQP
jgi:hypothetical protein